MVFHKFSLQEMTTSRPRTLESMAECYGVDAAKLERYGARLLTVIEDAISAPATSDDRQGSKPEELNSEPDLSERHDSVLFARLEAVRLEIAELEDRSPSAVFPDRTLMEMAALLPHTPDALAECHGVGPRKLERYGARFLDEIRAVDGT